MMAAIFPAFMLSLVAMGLVFVFGLWVNDRIKKKMGLPQRPFSDMKSPRPDDSFWDGDNI